MRVAIVRAGAVGDKSGTVEVDPNVDAVEPDDDLSEVIEAIWSLNGEPFDVIQEGFQRLELDTIQHTEDEPGQAAA